MPPGSSGTVPFNAVDEVVHVLDSPAEPWSIQLEVGVEGSLDEQRLREALAEALMRHPMARARKAAVSPKGERRLQWEITPEAELDPLRVVECEDDASLDALRADFYSRSVPLAESPPLRLRLARRPDGDLLLVNANHAAMDGFGTLRFVRSVARTYAQDPDPVPDVDPLEARDLAALADTEDRRTKLQRAATLADKVRDAVAAPARLAADGGRDEPGYGFHHLRLSVDQTRRLVEKDLPGTVNDVLLAALHLAVAEWNDEHGEPARRIGVMVPVNLRPKAWQQEVVGNLILPVRVATDAADRTDPRTVLEAVAEQSRHIKEDGTAGALIEVMGGSPSFPLRAKQATSPVLQLLTRRLADTALLSNLANLDDPPSFGDDAGRTTEVWFSAPARMPLALSVGVVTVAERLHAVLRYRHPALGADAARRFGERWVATLERFLAL